MTFDDRVGEALRRDADSVEFELSSSLVAVHAQVQQAGRRKRFVAIGAVAALLVLVVTIALLMSEGRPRSAEPIHGPKPTPGNPFRVTATHTAQSLGLEHVLGMAVAPNGHLYVTDTSERVAELMPSGHVLRTWGAPGTGKGHFRFDKGSIAVGPGGRVYVVDSGNFRIQVFSARGKYLESIGGFGRQRGKFLWPSDVAVSSSGEVYVADDRATTLTAFSPAGVPLWQAGGRHETRPDLVGHEHFGQVDAEDRLVSANDDSGVVLLLGASGHEVTSFGSQQSGYDQGARVPQGGYFPDGACDASEDARGYVFVTSCQEPTDPGHTTEVFDPAHRLIGRWRNNPLSRSPRFDAGGVAYAVTHDGSVVELAVAQ